jgi:cell division protein FtsL
MSDDDHEFPSPDDLDELEQLELLADEEHLEASETERDEAKGRHPATAHRARASWERPTRIAVGSLALVAIMFLFVFPTRSYLAQQRQVDDARKAVAALKVQNAQLAQQAQRLQTPSEIERLAREQFNMLLPNEQAYTVLSSDPTTTTTTP